MIDYPVVRKELLRAKGVSALYFFPMNWGPIGDEKNGDVHLAGGSPFARKLAGWFLLGGNPIVRNGR